jgi:hypothetical protein
VDAASLAGGRSLSVGLDLPSQVASCTAATQAYFTANFPPGWFGAANPSVAVNIAQTGFKTRTVTVTASVQSPLYFMRILGLNSSTVAAAGQASRRDVNLMLVLDRSMSMSVAGVCGTMVNSAVEFANKFTEGRDRLGLITYMGSPNLDYSPTLNFKTQSPSMTAKLGTLVCGGQTGTEPALWLAYQQLKIINEPGALNIIVLFTDGSPNGYPAPSFTIKRQNDVNTRYTVADPTTTSGGVPASTCPLALTNLPSGFIGHWSNTTPTGYSTGIWNNAGVALNDANQVAVSTNAACAIMANGASSAYFMRQDIAFLPPLCNHAPQHSITGYLGLETYASGPYVNLPRVDTVTSFHKAGKNITDNVATVIRNDATYTPVIYTIGLGGSSASDPIDDTFMERISNDPRSPIYDTSRQPGMYVFAPDGSQLTDAFNKIASEVLRLAQ